MHPLHDYVAKQLADKLKDRRPKTAAQVIG